MSRRYKDWPKPNIVTVLEHLGGRVIGPDRGGWRPACCPIHDDKNPSASINEDECRFSCFTCNFNGDAVDLIMEATGAGFPAALEVATGLLGPGDGDVPEERGLSGLVPRGSGNRERGSIRRPSWQSFGTARRP